MCRTLLGHIRACASCDIVLHYTYRTEKLDTVKPGPPSIESPSRTDGRPKGARECLQVRPQSREAPSTRADRKRR